MLLDVVSAEEALFEATRALTARMDVAQSCTAMLNVAGRLCAAKGAWVLLHDHASNELVSAAVSGSGAECYDNVRIPAHQGIVGLAFQRRQPVFVPVPQDEDRWFDAIRVRRASLSSVFTVPLVAEDDAIGVVGLECAAFSADRPPSAAEIERFQAVAALGAASIRNAQLLKTLEEERCRLSRLLDQRRQLRNEVGHLREQVREWHSFGAPIGQSAAFREVLQQVELVAPADSTVLLVGETGTGKELIARGLHEQSRRAGRPFVAVNCAALPESLVESELFGYERGAFTGAITRKPGKFELADSGTLFLDEIGDLPLQAQAKLLRVLQEREVQRVGGTKPQPVNVRLISATNQDLLTCMNSGRFRPDLFYRLSVFPVHLPSLRERREDVPLLVEHFLRRFADRQHKPVPRLMSGVMERLIAYAWPGNVRELQNVIERAVILARGPLIGEDLIILQPTLAPDAPSAQPPSVPEPSEPPTEAAGELNSGDGVVRFADAERHAIARALGLSGWRISGRSGAAEILGLKPTTLHAKMKRLGIRRPNVAGGEWSPGAAPA